MKLKQSTLMVQVHKCLNITLRHAICAMLLALSFYANTSFAKSELTPGDVTLSSLSKLINKTKPVHPALFGKAADFEKARNQTAKTDAGQAVLNRLIHDSNDILKEEPFTRELRGRRLLSVCRTVLYRVTTLSMSFRMTGNKAYLDRCENEMLAASAFKDWNPSHFLDVAEMTLALSIGYDWLYHDLSPETRTSIYNAILEKGLQCSLKTTGWVRARNNWGQVCHAGMIAGSLVTKEKNPGISTKIIQRAIQNLPRPMHAFNPKGAYPEGPGYWTYGTTFNVLAIDMLFGYLGTDFNLSKQPGFAETINYLDIVTGPSGLTFNYADGGYRRSTSCAMWWLAKHYNHPDALIYFEQDALLKYCNNQSLKRPKSRFFALMMFWLQDIPANCKNSAPLNWSSDSQEVITVHRTSWDVDKTLFIGFKGGSPSAPHGHMDAGSFVLDYAGIRWAWDLGSQNYHEIEARGMNLWSNKQDSDRWDIFRLNNFSHNTLVIDEHLQHVLGCATLKSFTQEPVPETVLDLTPVYKGQASKIIRSGKILPSGEVQIIDNLEGLKPGAKVRWQMMTHATTELDNSPVIILKEKDHTLKLTLKHNSAARWQIINAEKPRHEWDVINKGFKLIAFETIAPPSGCVEIDVLITPCQ